jgi:hypothetical protein
MKTSISWSAALVSPVPGQIQQQSLGDGDAQV